MSGFILFLVIWGSRTPATHIQEDFVTREACEQAYVALTKGDGIYSNYRNEHQCISKG